MHLPQGVSVNYALQNEQTMVGARKNKLSSQTVNTRNICVGQKENS